MLEGYACLQAYDGKENEANLQKPKITTNDLLEAIREHGLANVSEVRLAVLEVEGNISVLAGDR
ncbi:YetF domain-containing protein [Aerococcus urinaeequi]|uniref:YetF domain-containing protein n=1 Tax=Aerococcus urinaeequi TaxID=51665 RepID=UPI003AADFCEC